MTDSFPTLESCKLLKPEHSHLNKITLSSSCFTVGRSLNNLLQIPFIAISREHCKFIKKRNDWILQDNSSFGIKINQTQLGKGKCAKLKDQDIITLDQACEFVYKFLCGDDSSIPRKRIKLNCDVNNTDIINAMKNKFEESQTNEMKHLEDKIQNTKQIKDTDMLLKSQMQDYMTTKINQLNSKFSLQIQNLNGGKKEVERQKKKLLKERDAQLATLKLDMETKIDELQGQIKKHNQLETELYVENELLKKKLAEERQEFLSELNRENTLKQDMIDKLHAKMKEKEEVRLKEKKEFEETLKKKTIELKLEKDKELQEIQDQKKLMEQDLANKLNTIKKNLQEQVEIAEKQKSEVQEQLNLQIEARKKLEHEDKAKMKELIREREEIAKKLRESQKNAEKKIEELKVRVKEREVELAALAADRIQKQVEQSSGVITSLQEQLEKVRNDLKIVENQKKKLIESSASMSNSQCLDYQTLSTFNDIVESELQCTICAEMFISATTLNCSHSFCKYCISMWKRKKENCPICRAPIKSECKSLVLDSFIEKIVQNLPEEKKLKRQDILNSRKGLESKQVVTQGKPSTYRRSESDEYEDLSEMSSLSEYSEDRQFENSRRSITTVDLTSTLTRATVPQLLENQIIIIDESPRSRAVTTAGTDADTAATRAVSRRRAAPARRRRRT